MRIDPDPAGSELQPLGQYLGCQLDTVLLRSDGLSREELIQKLLPSDLTLGGLLPPGAGRGVLVGDAVSRRDRTRYLGRCGLEHRSQLGVPRLRRGSTSSR